MATAALTPLAVSCSHHKIISLELWGYYTTTKTNDILSTFERHQLQLSVKPSSNAYCIFFTIIIVTSERAIAGNVHYWSFLQGSVTPYSVEREIHHRMIHDLSAKVAKFGYFKYYDKQYWLPKHSSFGRLMTEPYKALQGMLQRWHRTTVVSFLFRERLTKDLRFDTINEKQEIQQIWF